MTRTKETCNCCTTWDRDKKQFTNIPDSKCEIRSSCPDDGSTTEKRRHTAERLPEYPVNEEGMEIEEKTETELPIAKEVPTIVECSKPDSQHSKVPKKTKPNKPVRPKKSKTKVLRSKREPHKKQTKTSRTSVRQNNHNTKNGRRLGKRTVTPKTKESKKKNVLLTKRNQKHAHR